MRFLLNFIPRNRTSEKLPKVVEAWSNSGNTATTHARRGPPSRTAGGAGVTSSSPPAAPDDANHNDLVIDPRINASNGNAFYSPSSSFSSSYNKTSRSGCTTMNINNIQTWGQQCSPNCGCTLRFETSIDPANNYKIVSAIYHAKTVVSTKLHVQNKGTTPFRYENGFKTLGFSPDENNSSSSILLQPIMTQRNNDAYSTTMKKSKHQSDENSGYHRRTNRRPLLKPCNCKTLHLLAETIVQVLPKFTLSQAQNQLEYSGIRSSPAFRYTVLKKMGLICSSTTSSCDENGNYQTSIDINTIPQGYCYDLVEEALMACLQGFIPKPRRIVISNQICEMDYGDKVQRDTNQERSENENDRELDPLRFVRAAKQRSERGLFHPSLASNESSSSSFHGIASGVVSSSDTSSCTLPWSNSSLFSMSSMPPFHLMVDASHDDGSCFSSVDTLTQLKMEIKSIKERDKNNMQQEITRNNDWVSYIDEKL